MQPRTKIIKRGADANPNELAIIENRIEKTDRERDREMAKKVKSWVAELEERNRALKNAALLLVHSLDERRQSSAVSVMVNG
jgi:hypothetical protein